MIKLGLGTWKLIGKQCTQIVKNAIQIGYRHIDTAFAYENHEAVAKGMKGHPREDLILTSKFMLEQTDRATVEAICDQALQELSTDYLDLLLIHWPDRSYPMNEIFKEMQDLVKIGKIKNFGTSNFTEHHLQDAYDAGLKVPYNQVEFHPYFQQEELRAFCAEKGTQLIGFRPFGKGQLLQDEPLFGEIGKSYGKSGAQVILRWVIEKGIPTLVKASSEAHLKENFDVFNFSLSPEDHERIDRLGKNSRYCSPEWNDFDY